jgi:hypothetical protein
MVSLLTAYSLLETRFSAKKNEEQLFRIVPRKLNLTIGLFCSRAHHYFYYIALRYNIFQSCLNCCRR